MATLETNSAPRGGRRWPMIIIGMLAVHVAIMVACAMIATHDSSFAVVDDYYERAVNWDKSQAALRASQQLGWKLQIEPRQQIDPLGNRQIAFILTDASGNPIPNAQLSVQYFHDAHANQAQRVTLVADPGDSRRFTRTLPMRYAGIWEFHLIATANGQTFIADRTQKILNAAEGVAQR